MEQFINEIWKTVDVNPVYLVSNYGRVKTIDHPIWCKVNNSYSIRKGRFCKPTNKNSKHYWRVGIQINNKQKHFAVHRLVATAFIPNPNNLPQINHIDGNKDNNHVSNLEWCDNLYNMRHAIKIGLAKTEKHRKQNSEKCWMRKLNYEQVAFVRYLFNKTDFSKKGTQASFCKSLCKLFNLNSPNTILWIITNGTSKFINQDIVQTTNFDIWEKEYNKIKSKYFSKKKLMDYANELGIPRNTFYTRYFFFNKDLDKTISFYKNKYHLQ